MGIPVCPPRLSRLAPCAHSILTYYRCKSEEAHRQFAATPFFQAWDPAALAVYVASALYDAPDGTVKLKMPGIQEAVCFTETFAPSETFELLPKLDPRIETRWIVAGKLNAE